MLWGTLEDDGPTVREEAPTFREPPAPVVKTRRRTPRSQPLPQGKTLHGYPFRPFAAEPPALTLRIAQPRSSTLLAISGLLALVTVSALVAAIIAFAT